MSLILEALRKSEAERRRGQVPNLHAERAPAVAATRATAPAWPWLALALVAAVTLAWLARGAWSPTPGRGAPSPFDQPAAPSDAAVAAGALDQGAGDHDAAAAPPSVERDPPAATAAAGAATLPLAPTRAADNPFAAAGGAAASQPRIEPASTPMREADADQPEAGSVARPSSPVVASPTEPAPTPGVASVATRPAPAPAAPAAGAGNPPLRLSDLSTAERLELPPLKISMHLWDPSPARRFAIIDGARVNEGDRIGDAVVDEITANAVLLAWRGQQLQIPMR